MMLNDRVFRYFAILFTKNLLLILAAVSAIVMLLDIIDLLRAIAEKHVNSQILLQLILLKNYNTVRKVLPFVILFCSIRVYNKLANNMELIASYNLGLSHVNILAPAFFVVTIFAFIHLTILMPINAYFLTKLEKINTEKLHDRVESIYPSKNGLWLKQNNPDDGDFYIIKITRLDQTNKELCGVQVFVMDKNFIFKTKIDVPYLKEEVNGWTGKNPIVTDDKNNITYPTDIHFDFKIKFNQLIKGLVAPQAVSIFKMPEFIENAKNLGFATQDYEIFFWKSIFNVILFFSMVIIGYAFVNYTPKLGTTNVAYAKSIFYGITLYFINLIFVQFTLNKGISLIIAMLLPYFLSFIISLYILIHNKR